MWSLEAIDNEGIPLKLILAQLTRNIFRVYYLFQKPICLDILHTAHGIITAVLCVTRLTIGRLRMSYSNRDIVQVVFRVVIVRFKPVTQDIWDAFYN